MKFMDREHKEESSQDLLEELMGDEEEEEEGKECIESCTEAGMDITLDSYFRASYPIIWIRSEEDRRALELLRMNIKKLKKSWSSFVWCEYRHTTGLMVVNTPGELAIVGSNADKRANDPIGALEYIHANVTSRKDNPIIMVFHNVNSLMKAPNFVQKLKDAAYYCRLYGSHIILVGAVLDIPPELKSMITVYDLPLPNKQFFEESFYKLATKYKKLINEEVTKEKIGKMASAAVGMTALQGENALSLSIAARKKLSEEVIQLEKEQTIKRGKVLEFIHRREDMETLGGWYEYKAWIEERKVSLTEAARRYGLKFPKGVLVAGIPGCGKSHAARATSNYLGLPCLKFDLGKVFQSLMGQSEANIRSVLKTAEAVAPVLLWIEEIEKSSAGSQSSGKTDSGTTARVMATLLTWMQETTKPIFFFATCNNVESMPPELYRRGRFTEIWGVSEPDAKEREEIWKIKLREVRPETYLEAYDYKELVDASSMYTGAEIEVAVENAMFSAFSDSEREFTTDDLKVAIKGMIPQHITSKKQVDRTREWMKEKVRMVSTAQKLTSADTQYVQDGWDEIRDIRGD